MCLQSNSWVRKEVMLQVFLIQISGKIETLKSCDMPQIVTKPNRDLALLSGCFCQTTLKAGDG